MKCLNSIPHLQRNSLNTTARLVQLLAEYLPSGTESAVALWFAPHDVELKISKPRATKFGDYRPPIQKAHHRISINNNLNPYAFLITLAHEFAHLLNWEKHQNTVKPHGMEWKREFQQLLIPFMTDQVFPPTVLRALQQYIQNPLASSCSDVNLMRVLKQFDDTNTTLLEQVPPGVVFSLNGKRFFVKREKLRKRFKCQDIHSKKYYLISPIAEVKILG